MGQCGVKEARGDRTQWAAFDRVGKSNAANLQVPVPLTQTLCGARQVPSGHHARHPEAGPPHRWRNAKCIAEMLPE